MNESNWKIAFFALLGFLIGFYICGTVGSKVCKEYYRDGYMAGSNHITPRVSVNGIKGWSKYEK